MKEQFVTYELAIKLKELGFDEFCFGIYINSKFEPRYKSKNSKFKPNQKLDKNNLEYCASPLWQQAFDWFREKHDICSYIVSNGIYGYYFVINNKEYGYDEENCGFHYEEARLKCLEKLIEINEQTTKDS